MSVEFDSSLKITFKRKWSTRRTPQTIQDEGDALWSSFVYTYVCSYTAALYYRRYDKELPYDNLSRRS